MEPGPHLGRARDPDVRRQDRVQRAPQLLNVPPIRNPNSNCLASRVHAGIRPARSQRRDMGGTQPLERCFELALDGALLRLPLPPAEARPVVVQNELHGAFGHCFKATSMRGDVNQTRDEKSRRIALANSDETD
jgi:hypothetical protein